MTSARLTSFRESTGRFILVGVLGAIIELFIFSGLVRAGLGILYGNIVAFHCAFTLCFFLHYYYTHQKPFKGPRSVAGGFVKYAGLMYAQLIFGTLLLFILIDKFGWMVELAKIFQIVTVTPVSYAIQKLVIFRRGKSI